MRVLVLGIALLRSLAGSPSAPTKRFSRNGMSSVACKRLRGVCWLALNMLRWVHPTLTTMISLSQVFLSRGSLLRAKDAWACLRAYPLSRILEVLARPEDDGGELKQSLLLDQMLTRSFSGWRESSSSTSLSVSSPRVDLDCVGSTGGEGGKLKQSFLLDPMLTRQF